MSDDLIAFLKAWYEWATNGAPDGEPFSRAFGLCTNSTDMFDDIERGFAISDELSNVFGEDTPFGSDYAQRASSRTQHECPKRLAWVRERLIEAGELIA